MAVRARVRRDLPVDLPGEDELDQRLVKVCMLKKAPSAIASGISSAALLADQVGDTRVRDHDLDRGDRPPPMRGSRRWLTTPRRTPARIERICCCLPGGEELDHPADRLGGVDRVHRREDEVARLGRLERGLRGLRVAQLADQDHVRILAERAAERLPKRAVSRPTSRWLTMQPRSAWRISIGSSIVTMCWRRVRLMWSTIAASVVDFPEPVAPVTRIETAVLRRRAAARRAAAELLEARDFLRDDAERERDRAALPEAVDAEARQLSAVVGDVEVAALVELLQALGYDAGAASTAASRFCSSSGGQSSSGAIAPSRRSIGGWPSFRWMSLAPRSTARRRRAFRSIKASQQESAGSVPRFRASAPSGPIVRPPSVTPPKKSAPATACSS